MFLFIDHKLDESQEMGNRHVEKRIGKRKKTVYI